MGFMTLVVKNLPASAGDVRDLGSIPGFDPWVRKIIWRRAWDPTQVFLPGESHRQWSLEGYSPWGLKGWTQLWCWRRLLRVPWTARRSNQSILKEISPGISLEGMMLKLKLQYFGHLLQRVDSLEKTLMLRGIGGQEEKGTTKDEMAGWHH